MTTIPILYVEDDDCDVILVQRALRIAGLSIPLRVVVDGKQAVDYLAGRHAFASRADHPLPSMVLLDLNLPLVSGFEVLEWIRRQPSLQDLPVVIFSGSGLGADAERARQLGANEYAIKPDFSKLPDLLRRLFGRWLAATPAAESETSAPAM